MSDSKNEPPFFIGWEASPAAPISAFLKKTTLLLIVIALLVAGLVAALQRTITSGRFDFGNIQEFSGVIVAQPAPMLIADSPIEGEKILYLVAPLKYGFPQALADEHHLKHVSFKGTYLGDGLESMIEVLPETLEAQSSDLGTALVEGELGSVTLQGEIVDSKCHLGVMNPGRFKAHRACAIQCLSGGIPPILVAQTESGESAYYLLVGPDGSPINQEILDYVAEPVEINGSLKQAGDRNVVYLDPADIRRL